MRLWIDASFGVAGDMLLGALCDAGVPVEVVQSAIDSVIPASVVVSADQVRRGGLRACKVAVSAVVESPPYRAWSDISGLLASAALDDGVRSSAVATFSRLAAAEALVHGIPESDVHFHEVGALDSIADVVGVCAAVHYLGVSSISAGPVALGSGSVGTAHGRLPVPAPAVAELARGWRVTSGGVGELATPTGMALIRALAGACTPIPPMTLDTVGVGAGTKDFETHPNVVRVFLGRTETEVSQTEAVVLEANVDDLDPRLWPGVIAGLLDAGADDAWLVPIVMKKGRPAHTLTALCSPATADAVRTRMFRDTSTLGVRTSSRSKTALPRTFAEVTVEGHRVRVKLGLAGDTIVQATPEFEDVAALARALGIAEREAMSRADAAAAGAGLTLGARHV